MQIHNQMCPRCGQPLTPNEMYCQNCGTYHPKQSSNTDTGFPVPPNHLDASGQNWTYPDIKQDTMPRREEKISISEYHQQPLKQPLVRITIGFLGILLIVLLLSGAYMLGRNSNTTGNQSSTTPASPTPIVATSQPSGTATLSSSPTSAATSTTSTVDTGTKPLYKADFNGKDWTMVGFKVNPDNSLVCNGAAQCSAVTNFIAPQDYTIKMTVQYLGNPGTFRVHSRINDQDPEGATFGYDGLYLRDPSGSTSIGNADINQNASFTVNATYKGGNVTIVVGQAGTNSVATSTTANFGSGTTSITVDQNVSLKVSNFEIYTA